MIGKQAINWLERHYGDLHEVVNYNDILKRNNIEIAYYNGYWAIEDMDLNEVVLDEEVLELSLDYYKNMPYKR